MKKTYFIFDYFKEAFHLNKRNKQLYKPQITLIILKVLMLAAAALLIYSALRDMNFNNVNNFQFNDEAGLTMALGAKLLGIALAYFIVTTLIESGLYNMYKQCVLFGEPNKGAFLQGVGSYFPSFFLGELVIGLFWIIVSPLYLILGTISLFIGFTLIPMAVSIFLTMWKVSLVMNDTGIFRAFKDSFRFAARNFVPLTILQLINWSFVKGGPGKGSGGSISNIARYSLDKKTSNNSIYNNGIFKFNNYNNSNITAEEFHKVLKVLFSIFVPVISVAVLVSLLIKMIFGVFFSLAMFIAYMRGFTEPQADNSEEVIL